MLNLLRRYGVWPITLAGVLVSTSAALVLTTLLDLAIKQRIVPVDVIIGALVVGGVSLPFFYAGLSLFFRLDQAEQHLRALTREDSLTKLFNRRYFFEVAAIEFERARRYGTTLSLMMIDLDFFKRVNDKYGHQAGDRVLNQVAHLMQSVVRATDIVGRYGGEEFVVLLTQAGLAEAMVLAERLRSKINNAEIVVDGHRLRVSISIGVSERLPADTSFDDLVSRADSALYQAKAAGRNRTFDGHGNK